MESYMSKFKAGDAVTFRASGNNEDVGQVLAVIDTKRGVRYAVEYVNGDSNFTDLVGEDDLEHMEEKKYKVELNLSFYELNSLLDAIYGAKWTRTNKLCDVYNAINKLVP